MHVMNTLLHMNESSVKMPETSAIITLFRLKRSHVVYYSVNNNSLFSTPWVFLTMFCSFHINYREGKRRKKKKNLFWKKKYQKVHSKITCQLATTLILFHHRTANENTFFSHSLWRVDAFEKTEIETVWYLFVLQQHQAGWPLSSQNHRRFGVAKDLTRPSSPAPT